MRLVLFWLVAVTLGLMGAFGAAVLAVGPFDDLAAPEAGLLGFCVAVGCFGTGVLSRNWMHARRA